MNRIEALRILGLDEDATDEDIKIAYKETAQILHPDKFATNKKLRDRATEQFKNLQEAYEFLISGKGKSSADQGSSRASSYGYSGSSAASRIEAQLAGISAARTQLVAQRDAVLDERRNALILAGAGIILAIFLRRIPIVIPLASTAVIWGIVQLVSAQKNLSNLNEHIDKLNKEQKRLAQELDDLQ